MAKRYPKWVAAAVAGWFGAWLCGSELRANRLQPAITVFVYDYGCLDPKELGDTKRVATRVLEAAGVRVGWRNIVTGKPGQGLAPTGNAIGPTTLVLRLLPAVMANRFGFESHQCGFAQQSSDGGFPYIANVFCQRAEWLAQGKPSVVPTLLGHFVAHEIGHLLLGNYGHSARGIMRTPWEEADLHRAVHVGLNFTSDEGVRLRANVKARIDANTSQQNVRGSEPLFGTAAVSPR